MLLPFMVMCALGIEASFALLDWRPSYTFANMGKTSRRCEGTAVPEIVLSLFSRPDASQSMIREL
jgi:hypothetical protein